MVTYPLPPSRFLRRRHLFAEEEMQAQRGGLTRSGLHSLSVPWGPFETWCLLSWLFGAMGNPAAWTGPFPAFLPLTLSIHLVRLRLKPVTCQAPGMSDECVVASPRRTLDLGRLAGAPAA